MTEAAKDLVLPEAYAAMGWMLEWGDWGWVKAVHPEMGETRSSFPAKHRGLKFTLRAIDKIHEKHGIYLEELQ